MQESFGTLLGEFLDKAVMAFDDLSIATEQFIDKSVSGHFVNPHAADTERLNKFNLSLADIIVENENEKAPKPISDPKPETKKRHHRSEHLKDDNPEQLVNEENIEKEEMPTEPDNVDNSQENSQRRRKHRRHHQEQQE